MYLEVREQGIVGMFLTPSTCTKQSWVSQLLGMMILSGFIGTLCPFQKDAEWHPLEPVIQIFFDKSKNKAHKT
jgi:hypothetical protein